MSKVLLWEDARLTELMSEVRRHPALVEKIEKAVAAGENAIQIAFDLKPGDEVDIIQSFGDLIGFLAAEVGILMDGTYTHEDICGVSEVIRKKLAERRVIHLH